MKYLPLLIIVFLAVALFGQTGSAPASPGFEAATLKPGDPTYPMGIGTFFTRPGGRIDAWGCSLEYLLRMAYQLDAYQILELPAWARQDPFDMSAVPPPDSTVRTYNTNDAKRPPPPEEREMLKSLLAERFQLKVHEETKDGPAFDLVLKSRSPRLVEPLDKEARPNIGTSQTNTPGMYSWKGRNASMEVLALRLAGELKRPVIDRTGLAGNFDFTADYEETPGTGTPHAQILQQLGLALVSSRAPTRYIVIDHIERLQPR